MLRRVHPIELHIPQFCTGLRRNLSHQPLIVWNGLITPELVNVNTV